MVELATTARDHGSSNYSLTSKKIDEIFALFGIKKSERIDPLITELSGIDSGKRKSTRLELGLSLATSSQNHGNLGHSRYSNHQRSVHTETSYTEGPASS
ncbi:hypothetical protein ASPCAL10282 [Aspergillus calidoustus]|uniref:Uncharacterized protein n=1 Tax=Aspergillus calidoustus TaxID=454130 RepID=A0A0U5GBK9_ASPCI|nr:hypothetical protein ASPCAL10282 [Aspergillus calidoustus]